MKAVGVKQLKAKLSEYIRLAKAGDFDAIVMAAAAVERLALDMSDRVVEVLEPSVMLPQVAQGALAVECRGGDDVARELLGAIEHPPSRLAVDAERAFLAELGGDCDLPAGAFATVDGDELTVSFWGGVCSDYAASVSEKSGEVKVTVTDTPWEGKVCIMIAKVVERTVTLDEPLGDRKVVGSDGKAIPEGGVAELKPR